MLLLSELMSVFFNFSSISRSRWVVSTGRACPKMDADPPPPPLEGAGSDPASELRSEVVLERLSWFLGLSEDCCFCNFSSISRSLAAVSTGLAAPKIDELLFSESLDSTGAVLLASCNLGRSRGASVKKSHK